MSPEFMKFVEIIKGYKATKSLTNLRKMHKLGEEILPAIQDTEEKEIVKHHIHMIYERILSRRD